MNCKLPEHLFVSSCGDLFDTRRPDWSKHPLRHGYALVTTDLRNSSTIALRAAIRQKYAWPGGYALYAITTDGECLCMTCCRTEFKQIAWSVRNKVNDGWRVSMITSAAFYDEPPTCDHCNNPVDAMEAERK